ncbi:MAG: hypothetical protein WBM29_04215, partial [Candidatus Deferrimicrobium sp.]
MLVVAHQHPPRRVSSLPSIDAKRISLFYHSARRCSPWREFGLLAPNPGVHFESRRERPPGRPSGRVLEASC